MFKSAVASGHPQVTAAACEVLQTGGNAFDAAVAAGFAGVVAEPALTSLGGGGFLLARPRQGPALLFDFFVDTPGRGLRGGLKPHFVPVTVRFPGSDQVFNAGLGAAAVPGNLRGFLHVHRRLGRLPLERVLAPARRLAREGLRLNAQQAYLLDLVRPIMTLTPAGCALFQPKGAYVKEGDHFTNPALAAFLGTLPGDGEGEFYAGEIARRIAREMQEGGGLISVEDLAAYRVIERAPLRVEYRDWRLLTNPPPAFGGGLIGLALRLLGACQLRGLEFGSPAHLGLLVAVLEEVEGRRAQGDWDPETLSQAGLAASLARVRVASGGTTQVSVADSEGNVASMTTSNGEGSGYIAPGTGIMLNNMLGEDDLHPQGFHVSPPGLRVASMMAPSLLLKGDTVRLVLGSGGSKRIRSALTQVISAVVDFGMGLREAVEAPRLHWDGACVQVEPGFTEPALGRLERRWPVNRWPAPSLYFGGVHAVSPTGEGAGDPRRGGSATVLDAP